MNNWIIKIDLGELEIKIKIFAGMCLFTTEYVEAVTREVLDEEARHAYMWGGTEEARMSNPV